VAYFGRIRTKLYKTQYIYIGNVSAPVSFFYTSIVLPPPSYCVPPFAKSVRLVREPQTASMRLVVIDPTTGQTHGIYIIPSGVAPVIPLEGNQTIVQLQSATAGGADKVNSVNLIYELAF
jgi:hypothetical protein